MKHIYAFTLIEIPFIIFIIGICIALVLPFISHAREAARVILCGDNLRNLSLAALNHESAAGAYPSGGWNENWYGDPDVKFGPAQPGSWTYSLLPFLGQEHLFQLPADGDPEVISDTQKEHMATVAQTPVPVFCCPSRRMPEWMPLAENLKIMNCAPITNGAKCDYAGNVGALDASCASQQTAGSDWEELRKQVREESWVRSAHNGTIYDASAVAMSEVTDGTSNTYLIGEKCLNPEYYDVWSDGDQLGLYAGQCSENSRSAGNLGAINPLHPAQDSDSELGGDFGNSHKFGSSHKGTFGMAMSDGSVQRISYNISGQVHMCMAVRNNDEP